MSYEGPAGVHFTPEELLEIWRALSLIPTADNASARSKVKRFLEQRSGDREVAAT